MRCCSAAVRRRREPELDLDVRQLRVGLLDAAPGDRPEVGRVVGDERQLERLRAVSLPELVATTGTPATAPHSARMTDDAAADDDVISSTARLTRGLPSTSTSASESDVQSTHNVIDCAPNASTPGDDPANTCGRYPVARSYASATRAMAADASRPADHRDRAAAAAAGDPRAVQTRRRPLGPHQLDEPIGPRRAESARHVAGVRLVHQRAESTRVVPRPATSRSSWRKLSARWRS